MEKFKPLTLGPSERKILKLWDNIEKTIHAIRDLGLPKEVKEALDGSLKKMTDTYAKADLNSGLVAVPDWMLEFNPVSVQEVNDVPRFKYVPKV